MTEALFYAICPNSDPKDGIELTVATLALGLMFYVEIFRWLLGRSWLFTRRHEHGLAWNSRFSAVQYCTRAKEGRSIFAWSTCSRNISVSVRSPTIRANVSLCPEALKPFASHLA